MVGVRDPAIYGNNSIANVEKQIESLAKDLTLEIELFQSNHEGQIIDKIQNSSNNIAGLIINPAAFTHTSIATKRRFVLPKSTYN